MPGQPCVRGTACGDGIVQVDAGEDCDEGANNGKGGCSTSCKLVRAAVCGDGVVGTGEACDDGNTLSGDGCSATCTVEPGWLCAAPGRPCSPL
jgi:cysteine-rich repeat protein